MSARNQLAERSVAPMERAPLPRLRVPSARLLAVSLGVALCSLSCAETDNVKTGGTPTPPVTTKEGDSLPGGAISFYNAKACPKGWVPFADGAGRVVVPLTGSDEPLVIHGTPLKDGEDRTHGHSFEASLSLTAVSYAGIAGEANHGVAGAQVVTFPGAGEKASSGLPYVQLLACKKLGEPVAFGASIPKGMMIYYNGVACPEGWKQPVATQGRMLVGLPDMAMAGVTFGGAALKSGEGRIHSHNVTGELATTTHGIALASGCCGDGFAKNDTYAYSGKTTEDRADLPTIQVLQCQKD